MIMINLKISRQLWSVLVLLHLVLGSWLYNTNFFRFKVIENQLPWCKISMITTVVANKRIYQRDIPWDTACRPLRSAPRPSLRALQCLSELRPPRTPSPPTAHLRPRNSRTSQRYLDGGSLSLSPPINRLTLIRYTFRYTLLQNNIFRRIQKIWLQ